MKSSALFLVSLLLSVNACPGDEHVHERAAPPVQLTPPSRPLEWGDINIIHTTDSHGWLLGHQKQSFPEPNYSGDFGDFASFVTHMKQLAVEKDVDILLVDSGDLHDGTGLTDGFPAGGIDAHEANKFISKLPYDIMAIGNHELYIYANAYDMHTNFAPPLQGRYLTSNVNITVKDSNNNTSNVPIGAQYRKFKTRKGKKVTSLGVMFEFAGNSANTTVQPIQAMLNEAWFKEAISEEPDLFLLAGHMPVRKDKWPMVFDAIRAVHPTTPIIILGGHTHIRDCVQMDGRSMSLESGRYMETVGWLSANLDEKGSDTNISFSRRYLDPNRVTYEYHTRRNNFTFDTQHGQEITKGMNELANKYNLSSVFGTAPMDYTINRVPYPSNNSLLSLFAAQAVPLALRLNNTRAEIPNIILTNSGSQRFDVYSGTFTKNDLLTSSPFANGFVYIANVTYSLANKVTPYMNNEGSFNRRDMDLEEEMQHELYKNGNVDYVFRSWLADMDRRAREGIINERDQENATLGYVTADSCPGVGDDITHEPLPYFKVPPFLSSDPPAGVKDSDTIDLVFVDFNQAQVLDALNKLQTERTYSAGDVAQYSKVLVNEALGVYAQSAWN